MKTLPKVLWIGIMIFISFQSWSQGAIRLLNSPDLSDDVPSCGSHHLMHHHRHENKSLLEYSNEMLETIQNAANQHHSSRNYEDLYVIPVVFHVVYNNEQENLADSVILKQMEILNQAYRRHNANASQTRPVFLDLVADTKIEFKLAELDPNGQPTSGITRTQTDITHFGGTLPYNQNQTNEIQQWVNDSLYINWFRLTDSNSGGIDPWDPNRYLNIWIGDLRILEPLINNFEELVFIGLATPPLDHQNWPQDMIQPLIGFNQGVLMHYVAVGDNNPNSFPNPYQNLNSPIKRGKVLVHEVGHYLGLRHIWGDGDCTMDDYIADTPNASNHSNWGCNLNANTCTDNINGVDLPNMVENYMDYSSGTCQNSFTLGQADLMRSVLEIYRPFLAETISTLGNTNSDLAQDFIIYPNPFTNEIHISNVDATSPFYMHNISGKVVLSGELVQGKIYAEELAPGTYFLEIKDSKGIKRQRLVK